MNKKSRNLVAVIGVAVLALTAWIIFGPKASDQDQIKSALESAVKASKEGRPGGVVEYLTNHVQLNGVEYNVGPQFAKFIRDYHPDITLGNIEPQIRGDNAIVTSDLQFTMLAQTRRIRNVTFTLKKQSGTKWLVIPSSDWVLTGAVAPQEQFQEILSQVSGLSNSPF